MQMCDVCGAMTSDVVLLPACAESACAEDGSLCCYNVACRHGCSFKCITCQSIVEETHILKTIDGFVCDQCYQDHPVETVNLYQWWGMDIAEHLRRYETDLNTDDEFNSAIHMYEHRCYNRADA